MPDLFGNLGDSEPYVPNYLQDEIQFRIDNDLRTIAIPADGVVLGVVGDKNVNHVNFQMPAWYNGFDMSEFQARINFVDPEGNANYYTVNDMTVYDPEGNEVTGTPGENDTLYFTWLVDSYATQYAGTVQFSVRLFKLDNSDGVSRLVQAFNTQINACNVLSTIQLAEYVTQEQMEDILYHYMNELGDVAEELKADIEAKAAATLESIPDDYTEINNKIVNLKSDLSDTYYALKNTVSPGKNLYNPETAQHGIHLNINGKTNEVSGQVTSDYIYVIAGHNYWLNKAGNYTVVCWYDKEKNFISYNMHNASTAFTAPSGTVYVRFGMYDIEDIQFEDGTGVTAYESYYERLKYGKNDNTNTDDIANIKALITTGKNLYNKEKSEIGKHLNTNGITDEVGGYLTSEYIPVEPNTDYWLNRAGNYTVVCWYDDNKNCVGYGMHNASTAFTSASTAKYARLGLITGATDVQFEKGVAVTDFEPYYNTFTYEKPKSSSESLTYVLDASGNGDFTGWVEATTAIKELSNVTLIVKSGTYDIAAELGDEYLANYDVNVNGWGPVLGNGVHVKMEPGATLKFQNTSNESNVLTYFSPINSGNGGYTLEGGSIICKNCRYAIHEDEYSRTQYSKIVISGVYMYIDNTTDNPSAGTRCIGGGTGFCSNVIIEDCVFDTPVTDRNTPLVSFHTSAADNSKSQVVIKGNYFKNKGFLRLTWYGPSTLMSRFTVTNNNFGSAMPALAAEDSRYPNNNIELIQWNNIVRS